MQGALIICIAFCLSGCLSVWVVIWPLLHSIICVIVLSSPVWISGLGSELLLPQRSQGESSERRLRPLRHLRSARQVRQVKNSCGIWDKISWISVKASRRDRKWHIIEYSSCSMDFFQLCPFPRRGGHWPRKSMGRLCRGRTDEAILSCASEAGSPTNRPGSDKTRGQGSFGPSTIGGNHLDKNFNRTNRTFDSPDFTKTGWAWHVTICL